MTGKQVAREGADADPARGSAFRPPRRRIPGLTLGNFDSMMLAAPVLFDRQDYHNARRWR